MQRSFIFYLILQIVILLSCRKENSDNFEEYFNYEKANIIKGDILVEIPSRSILWYNTISFPEKDQPLLINNETELDEFIPSSEYSLDKNVDFNTQSIVVIYTQFLPSLEYYDIFDNISIDSISKTFLFKTICNQYGNKVQNTSPTCFWPLLNIFITKKIAIDWKIINSTTSINKSGDIDISDFLGSYHGELKPYNSSESEIIDVSISKNINVGYISDLCLEIPHLESINNIFSETEIKYIDKLILFDKNYSFNVPPRYNSDLDLLDCIIRNEKLYLSFYIHYDGKPTEYFKFIGTKKSNN